jgi:excinuclease ABC subunit B
MRRAIDETDRRREIQRAYNEEHGITPQSILSKLENSLAAILKAEYGDPLEEAAEGLPVFATQEDLDKYLEGMESQMREAAKKFEFEKAAKLRDAIKELRAKEFLFGQV